MKTTNEIKESIVKLEDAIVRCPKEKITNINTDESKRQSDFCIFILSFGRTHNPKTYKTLMEYDGTSLNQDLYFICSDDDEQLPKYIEDYGDRVLVFNKEKTFPYNDTMDNFNKTNIVLYARNITFAFANKLGYRYFLELDDDYDIFSQRIFYDNEKLMMKKILDYDKLFDVHLNFLKNTPCKTITMSQHGDYIGGVGNSNARRGHQRKVMNSFFCDVQNPYFFDGTINEDTNYYIQSGRQGILNFNLFGFALNQETTQQNAGGLTDIYLEGGTYLKSFYSVICTPSACKIGTLGAGKFKRVHHQVNSNYCYPKILDEKYSKHTYNELNIKEIEEF